MRQSTINVLLWVSRIVFGLTFLFSGFVKAVDPMGSAYKFIDYFRAFDLSWLDNMALFLGIVLAATEFTIGAAVLFGSYRKIATTLGLLFMLFFTPLTLYLAIANPVKDCGCFGDALVLTNWETFYKNIILLAISIFLFINRNRLYRPFTDSLNWIPAIYAFLFSIFISIIGIRSLPILDFRPYKVGVNIEKDMQMPEGAPKTQHYLIYEKDGERKRFTLEDYPAEDDSWTFVETITEQPKGEFEPKIKDFFVLNDQGDNITDEILNSEYVFLLASPNLDEASEDAIEQINSLYDYAEDKGYIFYCLTTQDPEKIFAWQERTGAEYPFVYSDATIIETIIRANPGMLLLHEGTILWKRNVRQLPSIDSNLLSIEDLSLGQQEKIDQKKIIFLTIVIFFAPILLLLLFEKSVLGLIKKIKSKKEKLQ